MVYSNSDTLKHIAGSNPAIPIAESAHSAGAPGARTQIVGTGNFEGMTHIGVIRKPYGERNGIRERPERWLENHVKNSDSWQRPTGERLPVHKRPDSREQTGT